MKKKWEPYKLWISAGGILLICGGIHLLIDGLRYNEALNSAPFSLWVLTNAVGFGVPAAACFVIGWILWKRNASGKDDRK